VTGTQETNRHITLNFFKGWPLILLISSLGLLLRLLYLNSFGLSLDEGLSVYFANSNLNDIVASRQHHNNPPLFFLIAHAWISVFQPTETSLRTLAIVFGMLTIPMIALLGARLWDRATGSIAAFLMAVMIFPIHYSQLFRNYSLFLLLSTACFYFFIRTLEEDRKSIRFAYIAFAVALIYTHTYSAFLLLAQNIYVLLFYREKRILLRWLTLQFVVILCALPWLIHLSETAARLMTKQTWIPQPKVEDLARTVRTYFLFLVYPGLIWIFVVFMIYALLRPFLKSRNASDSDRRTSVLLFLWATGSILPPFLLSFFVTPFYFPRYTIGSLPAFYLLFASGFKTCPKRVIQLVAALLIFVTCAFSLQQYYHYTASQSNPWYDSYFVFTRPHWREFIYEFGPRTRRGDLVAVSWGHKSLFAFYAPRMRVITIPALKNNDEQEQLRKINKLTVNKRRLWLIFGHPPQAQERFLLEVLKKHFVQLDSKLTVQGENGSSVYLFQLRSRAGTKSEP
jgi:mannosyltransferase